MTRRTSILYTRRNRVLLAGGIAALVFLCIHVFCSVTFLNNDDVSIQRALAGWQTGVPYPAHPFLNFLLSAPVSWLYRILPAVAWWGRIQQTMLLLSMTVIGSCLLLAFDQAHVRPVIACSLFVLLCLGVFTPAVARIAFTLTAGLLGTAAVALLLTDDPVRPLAWSRRILALGLFFACFLFRNSSGICLLPFVLLAGVYRLLVPLAAQEAAHRARIQSAVCVGVSLLLSLIAIATNAYGRVHFNAPGYEEFDQARSAFADYPHPSYAEDPALYASVGWDETLYELASYWCFLDERIDADALNTIAEAAQKPRTIPEKIADALENGVTLARENGQMQWVLFFALAAFLWMSLLCFFRQKPLLPALAACCFAGGAFLLCGYLCYTGRFLLRTFFLIAYPAIIGILLLALEIRAHEQTRELPRRVQIAASVLLLAPALVCTVRMCRSLVQYDPSDRLYNIDALYAYALAHPENIYIRDMYHIDDVAAFRTFPEEKPTNVIEWGGNAMYTGALSQQLALNGLETLNQDVLLQDNVYFITWPASMQEAAMLRYVEETLHAEEIERVDEFGRWLVVYRFRKGG